MRIVIHDYAGHPFQVQLSRELARRNHQVYHLYAGYNTTPKGDLVKRFYDPGNFFVEGIYTRQPLQKYCFQKRWRQEIEYGALVSKRIDQISPDLVISANTPLDSLAEINHLCKKKDIPLFFWLQDLIGQAAMTILARKMHGLGWIAGFYQKQLEKRLLQSCSRLILISEFFMPVCKQYGLDKNKISVIHNWAPLKDFPVSTKANSWSISHNLAKQFCFLYSGTLGMKHNPQMLLDLALQTHEKGYSVVVISEGPGANWLKQKKEELSLSNLQILNYQPYDQLPSVLAAGEVLIAFLDPSAGSYSIPSKVLTYLCAKRPVLLAISEQNPIAKIIVKQNAGLIVAPDHNADFINAALNLAGNPDLQKKMGDNGRAYAEKEFNILSITDKFEKAFATLN
jgi:colanic acid biosynthesis glycosyl transferase WcaI